MFTGSFEYKGKDCQNLVIVCDHCTSPLQQITENLLSALGRTLLNVIEHKNRKTGELAY